MVVISIRNSHPDRIPPTDLLYFQLCQYPIPIEWRKIVRKVQGLVGIIGLGLPNVEIPKITEETTVEFRLLVLILVVEESCVIPIPLPIVTTPTPHLVIRAKSSVVIKITQMRRGRQTMISIEDVF